MVRSRTPSQGGGSQGFEMERKYSVPSNPESRAFSGTASEDLHAWSIYRQNLNSDFTDSALGSTDKSPLPYGNFQLRDTTVQSILSHPRYGPKNAQHSRSALGSNMYTYLKFGLPRVFPPNQNGSNRSGTPQHFQRGTSTRPQMRGPKSGSRGPRDGSSGYDSSDNETTNQYKQNRKYRSDPDFRMQNVHPSYHMHGPNPGVPLAALQQGGMRQPNSHWNRNKSISEANLLSSEYSKTYNSNTSHHQMRNDPRRNSVADFGHHNDIVDHGHMIRPMSKAESHLSLAASRRGPSIIRGDYLSHDEDIGPSYIYPHLQVHNLGVLPSSNSKISMRTKQHLLINDVSFEARGGEVLAVMATSEDEGTAILDVIAGKSSPVIGDVLLNGQNVRKSALRSRVAYVQSDSHLCKDMTAIQTLRFHYDLKRPTGKLEHLKIDAIDRINVLIEDLGLEQVRNTKVSAMTISERRRLNVACHLLLDTDIVVLDQPTRGMDIFDTFFLVEYLRQWANGGSGNTLGRIVVLTLHPPTYEIFTMLSRILLISAGRTMFSGRRRDMLPYFKLVDYPCPSFKNPSDYYLDLVTLDDLSAEAMLESSQRIEQLAELFRQKQQPMSDPGPPSTLPMTVKSSNSFKQSFVLFTKAMFYTQPNTFIKWLSLIIMSVSVSLIMGAIFWDVPNTDPQLNLNDRFGYHYATMSIVCWPILLALTLMEARSNRKTVERDISDGLYGRFTYILVKCIINLLPSLFVWLVYLVPSYSMCGLYMQSTTNYTGFYVYIGIMLLYLSCMQIVATAFIYLFPFSTFSTILATLLTTAFFLSTGYVIHFRDIAFYTKWLDYISPPTWLLPTLLAREYAQEAIASSSPTTLCRNKQVQHKDIIVQLPCPPPNGTLVMTNFGYHSSQKEFFHYGNTPVSLVIFYVICVALACIGFILNCCRRSRGRDKSGGNKP
ncbi:PREDICTED: ATP-binding cassette sub-family G member 8 isoform X2 [Nicrophorus vespilloides]|uniref:ATP-binding cassette sub-family G member 8 isoform X2 n=1 Tax=Nicrophorus vespilloides TaxID=110193 RepID=A0ABM1M6U8_NICVS|nr:PREDICTED: ATP-binding cassette sub-family G member 8 isoform X2 [Nicrophorus vespilloides]